MSSLDPFLIVFVVFATGGACLISILFIKYYLLIEDHILFKLHPSSNISQFKRLMGYFIFSILSSSFILSILTIFLIPIDLRNYSVEHNNSDSKGIDIDLFYLIIFTLISVYLFLLIPFNILLYNEIFSSNRTNIGVIINKNSRKIIFTLCLYLIVCIGIYYVQNSSLHYSAYLLCFLSFFGNFIFIPFGGFALFHFPLQLGSYYREKKDFILTSKIRRNDIEKTKEELTEKLNAILDRGKELIQKENKITYESSYSKIRLAFEKRQLKSSYAIWIREVKTIEEEYSQLFTNATVFDSFKLHLSLIGFILFSLISLIIWFNSFLFLLNSEWAIIDLLLYSIGSDSFASFIIFLILFFYVIALCLYGVTVYSPRHNFLFFMCNLYGPINKSNSPISTLSFYSIILILLILAILSFFLVSFPQFLSPSFIYEDFDEAQNTMKFFSAFYKNKTFIGLYVFWSGIVYFFEKYIVEKYKGKSCFKICMNCFGGGGDDDNDSKSNKTPSNMSMMKELGNLRKEFG